VEYIIKEDQEFKQSREDYILYGWKEGFVQYVRCTMDLMSGPDRIHMQCTVCYLPGNEMN
jgi:hypothetical protein